MSRVILISIKPHFARALLDGSKRFELRRFVPRFEAGDRALIYSSSPERRIVGGFTVGRVAAGSADEVWEAIGGAACGLSEHGFFAYLGDAKRCAAVEALRPALLSEPAVLPFRPPQSYQFLRPEDPQHREVLALARGLPDS